MAPVSQRLRRFRNRGILLAGALLAGLLLAEGLVRVVSGLAYPRILVLDRSLGWRHVTDTSRTRTDPDGRRVSISFDTHGHRGTSTTPSRERGPRVLVLGDSFTEGAQVADQELFTARLAALEPIEVLNAGVGAWGTVQQFLYLRDEGLALAPDLVLLMTYENDLDDNCLPYFPGIGPRPFARLDGTTLRIVEDYDDAGFLQFCLPSPGRSFLFRHSALYRSLDKNVWQRLATEDLQRRDLDEKAAIPGDLKLAVLLGSIDRIHDLCRRDGRLLAVASIPSSQQVERGVVEHDPPLIEHCAARGIPMLPLLDPLRRARADGRRPYFATDIHWTANGHAVVAQALAPFVRAVLSEGR
jgi:hypothetical protein